MKRGTHGVQLRTPKREFCTLLLFIYNTLSWNTKKTKMDLNLMGHTSFWSTLMTLIYWTLDTIKMKTEALLDTSQEAGLQANEN